MTDRPEPDRGGAEGHPTGLQWMFQSRVTGRVSVAAWPNLPLRVWLATAVGRRLPFVHGISGAVLATVGTGALAVWAVGELWRGVNPWRRLLGLGVLLAVVITVAR